MLLSRLADIGAAAEKSEQTRDSCSRRKPGPGQLASVGITEHQRRMLSGARGHVACKGYPPTTHEPAETFGTTHASMHAQVRRFVRRARSKGEALEFAVLRRPKHEITDLDPVPILAGLTAGELLFDEGISSARC